MTLTDKEKKSYVDKHLTEIYPQLKINMQKVCGAGHDLWADDLLSISLEYFLKKPLDVQYESCLNNKAENFCTYIANFQLKSGYSKFWHIHRKFSTSTREYFTDNHQYDIEKEDMWKDDDRMLCIKEAIKDLDPYRKMLVEERVLKGMRFQDLADRYEIPYSSLTLTLKQTLKEVKEKCKHLQSYL